MDGQSLGRVIRARREELGLTQEELAERIGGSVRQAEVSRLERGRVATPRRARLGAIAAALGLTEADLLVRSGWAEMGEVSNLTAGRRDGSRPFSGIDLHELRLYREVLQRRAESSHRLLRDARRSADAAYLLLAPYYGFTTRSRVVRGDQ